MMRAPHCQRGRTSRTAQPIERQTLPLPSLCHTWRVSTPRRLRYVTPTRRKNQTFPFRFSPSHLARVNFTPTLRVCKYGTETCYSGVMDPHISSPLAPTSSPTRFFFFAHARWLLRRALLGTNEYERTLRPGLYSFAVKKA